MGRITTLGEFIVQTQSNHPQAKGELSRLLSAIRLAKDECVNEQN